MGSRPLHGIPFDARAYLAFSMLFCLDSIVNTRDFCCMNEDCTRNET